MSDQKPSSEKRKQVIVVDDDENTRRQLKRYLERLDCEVTSYSDVEEVKNYISENVNNILAVFLDLVIGNSDANSFRFLKDISAMHPDLPVFTYSAHDSAEKAVEAIRQGAYWYIDKHNAKEPEFLSAVQSALRTWQLIGKVISFRKFAEFRQHLIDAFPYEIMVRDENYNIILENLTKKKRFDCNPSEKSVVPVENEDVKTGLGKCNVRYEKGNEECKKDCSCDKALETGKPQQSDHPWERQMLHIVAAPISGEDNLVVETAADVSIQYSVRNLMQEIVRNAAKGRDEIIATTLQRLAPADNDKKTIKTGFKRAFAFLFNPPGNNKMFILQGCSGSTLHCNDGKQIYSLDENPVYKSILASGNDQSTNSTDSYVIDGKMYRTGVSETIRRIIGDPEFQIIIPICSSNHTDGFILVDKGLDNAEGSEFTWDEKHWCKVLSEFLSGIFITIRQYEGHKWLIETQRELARARKIDDIFDNLIEQIKTHFKADRVDVYDVNWGIEKIKLRIGHDHHPDCGLFKDGYSIQIGINGRACKKQEAEFVPDCRKDSDFQEFNSQKKLFGPCQLHKEDKQPCAVAIVPFTNSERVVGSLCIVFGYERVFDEIDRNLLRNLGTSLSLVFSAVEAAEQEQQRSYRRLGRNLAALFNAVENAGDEDKIIRYCLTYITAGCGLGYNRAIFYRMIDKENKPEREFELQYAIGQLNLKEWNDLFASNEKFKEMPFEEMLSASIDNQPSQYFSLLKNKFNTIPEDCALYKSLFIREAQVIEMPTARGGHNRNDYSFNLMTDTGSKSILVIGVYLDDKNKIPFGAFIVDSAFIGNLGDERNKADLNLFAAEVGHIFNEFYNKQQYEKHKTETLLGTITKYIGHDIKQPLTAMKPEIDTIKDFFDELKKPVFVKKCSEIEAKIDRVMAMIDRISRFYSDVYEDYDVLDVVNDAHEIVKELARKKHISMEIDSNGISKEALMVKGKAGILLQGLSNILTNAITAIECKYKNDENDETTNGTIKITVRKDAGTATVEITDNGIGMDDEQVEKIQNGQEIGSSKDDAGTGAGPRTGIGLSIFRESIKQNNAKFTVSSDHQKGTTFTIFLKII